MAGDRTIDGRSRTSKMMREAHEVEIPIAKGLALRLEVFSDPRIEEAWMLCIREEFEVQVGAADAAALIAAANGPTTNPQLHARTMTVAEHAGWLGIEDA